MERLTYMHGGCVEIEGAGNSMCKEVCDEPGRECPGCPINAAFERLKEYEDTGLEPQEIAALKLYAMGAAVAAIEEFDGVPIARLQELAKAEKAGRISIRGAENE